MLLSSASDSGAKTVPQGVRPRGLIVFCLSWAGLWTGCGSEPDPFDRLPVSGTVHVNGVPLQKGRITFLPIDGMSGPAAGGNVKEGKFEISQDQGPVTGMHRVRIIGLRPTGKQIRLHMESEEPNESTPLVDEIEQFIPKTYNERTTLTVDVTAATARVLAFELDVPD